MAENLDDGEFWLPPKFLADNDELAMEKRSNVKAKGDFFGLDTDASKALFPFEFPYGLGSVGVYSDLSSPVESVVGSSETESDEEEHIAELTRRMARSTLEADLEHANRAFGHENSKVRFMSGSPQSTLCAFGNGCGCKQGSSHGSPNSTCQFPSTRSTWDLLHAAAGEVERMSLSDEDHGLNHSRGLLGLSKYPSPVAAPAKISNPDVGFYTQQSLSHQQLQLAQQFQQLRRQQLLKQQQNSFWGGPTKPTPRLLQHQNSQMVPNGGRNTELFGGRNTRPVGLSSSVWPPQQQAQQQNQQLGSGMRAVFLGNPVGKRECAGTGVFLPRRVDNPAESRRKPACSSVLVPTRVVQALNLKLEDMMEPQPQYQPRVNGAFNMDNDAALMRLRNNYLLAQHKRNLRPQPSVTHEIQLPQEWTY
ncbi:TIP41-like protein [Quillaja saponaria]|uniref:TIP41-like protein n=1 Tax=Quillaja saponaria TaxID=32244 RepID=A0AAD7PCN6_QUISA|nr:TIP41-like protein [Quillaja saponaria]